jgi:hypothetical protein
MIRCSGDSVPFDIKTDRYFAYDKEHPEAAVDTLAEALRNSIRSGDKDSPVYALIPNLEEQDGHQFLVVPNEFAESVERAQKEQRCGDLELLATEAVSFPWAMPALRLIGRAQFKLRANEAARRTWENVLSAHHQDDPEANELLGTIYERLGDLTASDQAINRFLKGAIKTPRQRAEGWSLKGRNEKSRWLDDWRDAGEVTEARSRAIQSPFLARSMEHYQRGFLEDSNHYYSGINALFLATVICELGEANGQPVPEWLGMFPSEDEARRELERKKQLRSRIAAALAISIEGAALREEQQPSTYLWREVTAADYEMLTSDNTVWVRNRYRRALADVSPFDVESVRRQLLILSDLGVREENVRSVLEEIGSEHAEEDTDTHVILFVGHMIDKPDLERPRFPSQMEDRAREAVRKAISETQERIDGNRLVGIAGGACGGDMLFHEACRERGVDTWFYLALPRNDFIVTSVQHAGPDWVDRFNDLYVQAEQSETLRVLGSSAALPTWLDEKPDYSIWVRNNMWILFNALALSGRGDNLSVIALWDRKAGDGLGGTDHMVRIATERGARVTILDTKDLRDLDQD